MALNSKLLASIGRLAVDPESDPEQGSAPESPVANVPDNSEDAPNEASSSESEETPSESESAAPESNESPKTSSESSGASPIEDYHKYLITPHDIQGAADAKKQAGFLSGIGNSLGNIQSAGNFYLGHMNPKSDISGPLNQMASAASVPIQAKQVMMKQYQEDPQLQLSAQMRDPNSGASKLIGSTIMTALSTVKPRNPDEAASVNSLKQEIAKGDKNAYQLKEIGDMPLLKDILQDNTSYQKMVASINMTQARLDQGQQRIDQGNQRIAKGAGDEFTNNKNIETYQSKLAQIDTDLHTLQTSGKIPPQLANELSAGLASAFNGGKGAGFHQQQAQEIQSLQKDGVKALSYLDGKTYDSLSPDQKQFIVSTLNRIKQSYQLAQKNFADQQYNSHKDAYANNPQAMKTFQAAHDQFSPPGSQSESPSGQDPEIANYAKVYGYTYPQAEAIINARKQKLGGSNGQ